jgi:hypothetical protein
MTKLSFKIIGMNKSLLLFPIISGVLIMVIISTFAIGFWFFPQMAEMPEWLWLIVGFLLYVIMFFISYFFQAALVACAYETMEGKKPTVGYGIGQAKSRAWEIFKWAVISAIVGMILRAIEDRVPFASRIIGAAWSIATYFVVPIIVFEGNGAWASVKESWRVLKGSWGEALVGMLAMGLIFVALGLPVILIFVAAFMFTNVYAIGFFLILGVVYLVFIAILYSTVGSVLQTALYRYVKTGQIGVTLPNWLPPPSGTPAAAGQPYPVYDQQPQPPTY